MKVRTIVSSCLLGTIVLAMCAEFDWASLKADIATSKTRAAQSSIVFVSIRKIFDESKRSIRYRQEATAERNKVFAELEKLDKEIEAEKAGLKTLKTGSSDHLALVKEILEKQANLQAQQEFYKQQMSLKQQRMIEDIYRDILRVTGEVAQQKGLDLVFEKSEPEFPASSANELELTMGTHKLLYSGGCLDISDEVMALLDANN